MTAPRHWLMKSEPGTYSIDDLHRDGRTCWEGVRNYQARNTLRDDLKLGERVLFYHSSAKTTGVVGLGEVVREAHPDHTTSGWWPWVAPRAPSSRSCGYGATDAAWACHFTSTARRWAAACWSRPRADLGAPRGAKRTVADRCLDSAWRHDGARLHRRVPREVLVGLGEVVLASVGSGVARWRGSRLASSWPDGRVEGRAQRSPCQRVELELAYSLLSAYATAIRAALPMPKTNAFFVSERGSRMSAWSAGDNFVDVLCMLGLRRLGADGRRGRGPRLHDLRHRFVVSTLIGWYRTGVDVERELPKLATYLGHERIEDLYWYLQAVPELLQAATDQARQPSLAGVS